MASWCLIVWLESFVIFIEFIGKVRRDHGDRFGFRDVLPLKKGYRLPKGYVCTVVQSGDDSCGTPRPAANFGILMQIISAGLYCVAGAYVRNSNSASIPVCQREFRCRELIHVHDCMQAMSTHARISPQLYPHCLQILQLAFCQAVFCTLVQGLHVIGAKAQGTPCSSISKIWLFVQSCSNGLATLCSMSALSRLPFGESLSLMSVHPVYTLVCM